MPAPPHRKQPDSLPRGALELERRQGFADKAVIGGMGELLRRWCAAAASQTRDPALQRQLTRLRSRAAGYPQGSMEERRALVALAERLALRLEQAPSSPPTPKPAPAEPVPPGWNAPLSCLPGVGPARSEELAKAGLQTVGDLLQYYPFRHEDRRADQKVSQLEHRQTACLLVEVTGPGEVAWRNRQQLAVVPAAQDGEPVDLVWFNQPYRAGSLREGTHLVVTGQVRIHQGKVALAVSEIEVVTDPALHAGRVVPVYGSAPLSQVMMRKLLAAALEYADTCPESRVPAEIIARRRLMPLAQALREIHFPTDYETLREARARLAYDELFLLQVRLALRRRRARQVHDGSALDPGDSLARLTAALPFKLTGAQRRVMDEVLDDLRRPEAANRLIHGDVGAGKTAIAALALVAAATAGKQGVLMAPTEILARQHHQTLTALLAPLGLAPGLLVGGMSAAERRTVLEPLATGELPLVIGTHALFQEGVRFAELAVAVIDEQHRFGVRQRSELIGKGPRPNSFIMSATPIPRTLALTAYGDFDVSILDELPPGRRPVHTEVLNSRDVRRAYRLVSDVVERGQQAYIVCPLIEENAQGFQTAAEALYRDLRRGIFPSLKLGLVHGKLSPEERDAIMEAFRRGELEALVATTVIEVGVDVPNATAMVILDAERFGLAQLHQLRGRVARSQSQAYCVLVTGSQNPEVIDRLQVLERTSDGFLVAEEDLRRRGPGELAGMRQSGLPDPRMADLLADTPTLARAREDAFALIEADPHLSHPDHAALTLALGPDPHATPWTL